MKKTLLTALAIGLFLAGTVVGANATNIMLNSTVSFHGTNIYTEPSNPSAHLADLSTLTDGVFLRENTYWLSNTVAWLYRPGHSKYSPNGYIQFDLDGVFQINSFTGQFDDNDAYKLSYWDMTNNVWATAWDVPNFDSGHFGMTTRPLYNLASAITTNALRLEGSLSSGDNNFSASEVQAFGVRVDPIPEPATMLLFGVGLLGLAGAGRRKK